MPQIRNCSKSGDGGVVPVWCLNDGALLTIVPTSLSTYPVGLGTQRGWCLCSTPVLSVCAVQHTVQGSLFGSEWAMPAGASFGVPTGLEEAGIHRPVLVPAAASKVALALLVNMGTRRCWQVEERTISPGLAVPLEEGRAANQRQTQVPASLASFLLAAAVRELTGAHRGPTFVHVVTLTLNVALLATVEAFPVTTGTGVLMSVAGPHGGDLWGTCVLLGVQPRGCISSWLTLRPKILRRCIRMDGVALLWLLGLRL
mmetsp:Transcript_134128/g.232858  ORF Transcript_134128/g.232858 Transcript_134128/m.232858 type:complete len:257 (-) Transcript_134128:586-1356(-)